jgi:hypothetical protein
MPEVDPVQRLCRITIPGLLVKRDFHEIRRRLLTEFPRVEEVVATTAPETLIVLCRGREDVDAWIEALCDLLHGEPWRRQRLPLWRPVDGPGGDAAA